jgi:nucleoid-associated protein YgaU/CHAT domain-containing protein
MNVFLSYASQHKDLVRPVCTTLRAAGFDVFFDETDLPASEVYDDRIREAIERSDLYVFVLSPEAVTPGRYTLTELLFAEARWPNPRGRVLAVLPLDTPEPTLPDYLRPLTLQKQVGNLAAEVLATVRRMEAALAAATPTTGPVPDAAPGIGGAAAMFQSLNLRFRQLDADGYSLSLAGAAQADATPLPAGTDPQLLEQALWQGAQDVAGTTRRGDPATLAVAQLPSAEAVRTLGTRLHDWLFSPALQERLREPLRRIDRQRGKGVRFVLNTTEAPALARLPWEFAYDTQRREYTFTDPMKPLVRWLDVDETLPTLAVQPPLRLLIAVASPGEHPGLAVGDELAHLDRALAELTEQGLLQTLVLEHASLSRLNAMLLECQPHVLHFIGHGDFHGDEGTVLFERDEEDSRNDHAHGDGGAGQHRAGLAAAVSGQRLAGMLQAHLRYLRLVFLNSCLGASAARRDPFGGIAQALVGRGVPAVVAMQFAIPDRTATALAQHFYRYLAAGRPVDEALTAVRALLYAQGHEVEWGAPVLTMRTPDGRLFDIGPAAPLARTRARMRDRAAQRLKSMAQSSSRATHLLLPSRAVMVAAALLVGAAVAWWLMQEPSAPDGIEPVATKNGGSEPPPPPPPPAAALVVPPPPVPAPVPAVPVAIEPAVRAAVRSSSERLAAGDVRAAIDTMRRVVEPLPPGAAAGLPTPLRAEVQGLLLALGDAVLQRGRVGTPGDAVAADVQALRGLAATLRDDAFAARLDARLMPPMTAAGPDVPDTGLYTVRRGDSLWSIARQRYGNPFRWPEIHTANRAQLADPSLLQPGQRLRIPPHPSTTVDSVHIVREGDSLWRIAARLYGDGRQWPRLRDANAARIADPQLIRPGMELRIPAAR